MTYKKLLGFTETKSTPAKDVGNKEKCSVLAVPFYPRQVYFTSMPLTSFVAVMSCHTNVNNM